MNDFRFCPRCATELHSVHDGERDRLRCPACHYTHWNNPTPVLAAIIELSDREGRLLLARNAAWPGRMFALVTGFMEAGETPEEGIKREIAEETSLQVSALHLEGVCDFQQMNQVIIAYHAVCHGEIVLSPELAEYKLLAPQDVKCWRAGTGEILAQWLRRRGHEPQYVELPRR
ncbi:NUDIX domain-containing protein [Caldimonas brevitalea]|uniref:ADP-ribose pyrophosphatase n=1 Tax=Caldimonas brevitalea TaxID=413882 RepID=A0A0G3BRE9_9BURK|nr:NUDIX domain-containing protein [Caldimonas brevitalea]AKJ30563.1 ADP-ribose pyrophosphatase [Caldimonas brevitalea]